MRTVLGLRKKNVADVVEKKEEDFQRIMSSARTPRILKPKKAHLVPTSPWQEVSDIVYYSTIELANQKLTERARGLCQKCRRPHKIDPNGDSDICNECRIAMLGGVRS